MGSPGCLADVLSLDGLGNAGIDELQRISAELALESVAYEAAQPYRLGQSKMPDISAAAPLLALRSAVRNFVPNGKPYTLTNYLKRFTTLWARRLAANVLKAKQIPVVDLQAVLAEVKGQHMFEELKKSMSPENQSNQPACSDECKCNPEVLDVVGKALGAAQVSFTLTDDTIHSTMKTGSLVCHFWFKVNGPDLGLLVGLPVFVSPIWRNKVCAAMNAINWKLLVGNFEMDPEDGEIRFRATMPLHGAVPTVPQVDCLFGGAYHAIREYGLALVELGLTDHDSDWLIARAEREFDPNSQ